MPLQEINLLPPERRRRVRNESIAVSVTDIIRSINAGLLLMTLLAAAIVASIWLFSLAATPTTEAELTQLVEEYQTLRDKVAEDNVVLERLESLGRERLVWSVFLSEFFEATPPGITLDRLSGRLNFAGDKITNGELTFQGQAVTRSALIVYESKLKTLPQVKEVSAPTTNLLERNNPPFQFSITLTP